MPGFITSQTSPIGWASTGTGTTGGGKASPVLVTTLSDLNAAAKGSTAAVIYVKGKLAQGTLTIGSNKTIIGCSEGATINGHVEMSGSKNVILRNLSIVGYNCAPPDVDTSKGGQCQNGQDAVSVIDGATNLWFDHDAVSDGSDGNLDITLGSDLITISYTKFFYSTKRTDPNDTGAKGHRYSNLIGGDDSLSGTDGGKLNVTFHHDWWADNVMERMPRVRFGKVHLFNNLWTATGNDYCIGVGVSANIFDESNAFIGSKVPVNTTSYSNGASAAKSINNIYTNTTTPSDMNPSSVFKPPYAYTPEAAAQVQADVQANAGPK